MNPPKPLSLTFHDVSYQIPVKASKPFSKPQMKPILHGVSGHVYPGEFLAILGPSGAGKSTLLNLLASRSAYPPSSGSILFGGRPRIPRTKRYIGYVTQDDIFFNKLTVRETLEFTARIRLPDSLSVQDKLQYVDDIIQKVGLTNCQRTRVGDAFEKGISGGERKRLNIANELIHGPSLFLADEPTSGLDSSSAMTILNALDEIKQNGRTVVVSIHQPSSKMFRMFTNILVLASGRVAYFGSPDNVIRHFESIDFPFPGLTYNPADYVLELVIDNNTNSHDTDESDAKAALSPQQRILDAWSTIEKNQMANEYLNSTVHLTTNDENVSTTLQAGYPPVTQIQRMKRAVYKRMNELSGGRLGDEEMEVKYTTNWLTQLKALMKRSALQKQGILLQGATILQIVISTCLILIFWLRMEPTEERIEDRLGFIFFITANWGFLAVSSSIFAFPLERRVLTKDRSNGLYRLSAYYIAKTIVEIPADTIFPILASCVVYYAVGMNPDFRSFLLFTLFMVLNGLIGQSIGLVSSTLFMNVRQSLVLGISIVLASFIVSGYMIDIENIPSPIRFARHLSFFRYSYEGIIRCEFLFDRTFECASDPTLHTVYSQNGTICPIDEAALFTTAQLSGMLPIWAYLCIQIAYIAVLRFIGYFALKHFYAKHKPKLSEWKTS